MVAYAPIRYAKARPVELCQLAGRWNGFVPDGGTLAEEKYDGWRALWFRGLNRQPGLWTRNGMAIEGTAHIRHWLSMMEAMAGQPMFFDGEFVVEGSLAATKSWCERGWKQGGHAGKLYLFDAMPLSDWEAGRCDTRLIERKAYLADLMAAVKASPLSWEWAPGVRGDTPDAVELVSDIWLSDAADVRSEAARVWARGGEGLILKDAEAPYVRARSNDWRKLKRSNVN